MPLCVARTSVAGAVRAQSLLLSKRALVMVSLAIVRLADQQSVVRRVVHVLRTDRVPAAVGQTEMDNVWHSSCNQAN